MIPNIDFSVLLYNCTGARTKLGNIRLSMQMLNLRMAILTETWHKQGVHHPKECIAVSSANVTGRSRGFGGTCFFIPDPNVRDKVRTIEVDEKNGRFSIIQLDETVFASIYLSPLASLEECTATVEHVIGKIQKTKCASAILAGDFNLRHTSLGCAFDCKRGEELIPTILGSGFICKNDGNPTHRRDGWAPSMLDLIFTLNLASEAASPNDSLYLGKSNHIPVIMKARLRIREKTKSTRQRFNLENAQIKEKRESYMDATGVGIKALDKEVEELSLSLRNGRMKLTART